MKSYLLISFFIYTFVECKSFIRENEVIPVSDLKAKLIEDTKFTHRMESNGDCLLLAGDVIVQLSHRKDEWYIKGVTMFGISKPVIPEKIFGLREYPNCDAISLRVVNDADSCFKRQLDYLSKRSPWRDQKLMSKEFLGRHALAQHLSTIPVLQAHRDSSVSLSTKDGQHITLLHRHPNNLYEVKTIICDGQKTPFTGIIRQHYLLDVFHPILLCSDIQRRLRLRVHGQESKENP